VFRAAVDGQTLRFRLVGINNQNFVMQDEQTGSWWQQVTGEAIFGPLRGARLELLPHDEVAFAIWKGDHPAGRVLRPDPAVEQRAEYAPIDWDEQMTSTPTVTMLPPESPLAARTLVVGVAVNGAAKAYPLDRVRQARALVDTVGGVPIVVVVADDGKSVRAFDRRVDGMDREFVLVPGEGLPVLVDLLTGTEWTFAGNATTGPLAGRRLTRVPFLLDYWFDWQTYHPETEVHRVWTPRVKPPGD
jgi:hypothetical protein